MSDASVSPAATINVKSKKAPRSDREWLDQSGAPIDDDSDYQTARGGCYTFKATGKRVERIFTLDNPNELFMYATFGFLTLMGNVANAKSPEQGYDDCLTRADLIKSGKWVERTGVGGPRYNPDNLARAISIVKHGDDSLAHVYAAKIGPDKPKVREHHDSLQGKVTAAVDIL